MSKRFYNLFHTLVLLALTLGIVHFASSVSFSADTYTVPQTAEVTLAWDPNDPSPGWLPHLSANRRTVIRLQPALLDRSRYLRHGL